MMKFKKIVNNVWLLLLIEVVVCMISMFLLIMFAPILGSIGGIIGGITMFVFLMYMTIRIQKLL